MGDDVTTQIVSLGELFNKDQIHELSQLLSDIVAHKRPPKDLKEWLITLREQLESKGVLPEYLYYLLCYQFKLLL